MASPVHFPNTDGGDGAPRPLQLWMRIKANTERIALGLLVMALAATVLELSRQLRALRPQAEELQRRKVLPYVGQIVPTVRATTTTGDTVIVGETQPGRSQVLFFLSPSCQYCAATLPAWNALAARLQRDSLHRFDVYGISLSSADSTAAYVAQHQVSFPVVRFVEQKARQVYRVKAVPMTLVVGASGDLFSVRAAGISTSAQLDSLVAAAVLAATDRRMVRR